MLQQLLLGKKPIYVQQTVIINELSISAAHIHMQYMIILQE